MTKTGGDLIKLKDDIHTKWFELQRTKRSNKGHAFLSKPLYDEIVRLGHEALATLKEIDPNSRFIKRIQQPLHETQLKSWVAEDVGFIGPTPYYVMTQGAGQVAITQNINRLANEIHHAGMSFIRSRGDYCGCRISEEIEDLSSINTGVLKYCEGALERGGRVAWIRSPGDIVEHRPGSARSHVNRVQFEPTEEGFNIDMRYTESGDDNWRLRRSGVMEFIKGKGGTCETYDQSCKCTVENASEEDTLDLALMVSQLKDIDLLAQDCIPMAFELIALQANDLKQLEPKERIWDEPWERVRDMPAIVECSGEGYVEEEETRSREEVLHRRLTWDIGNKDTQIQHAIDYSKIDPCTYLPYSHLSETSYYPRIISDNCERIKTKTIEPYGWCLDLAKRREQEIAAAAKELVGRCPPEGIILGLEAEKAIFTIDEVKRVCSLIGDQDCLDIIKQVEAREQAGIKPGILNLKPREEVSAPA
jgi:hypothetical protein